MNTIKVDPQGDALQHQISVGRHRLMSDADVVSGGDDAGPTPHEYLAASLGACTAITLKMYARRKNWVLKGLHVEVTLKEANGTATFFCSVALPDDLSAEQKERLMQIADHCPVHKILNGQIEIQTVLTALTT